jgi:hypothetical protein
MITLVALTDDHTPSSSIAEEDQDVVKVCQVARPASLKSGNSAEMFDADLPCSLEQSYWYIPDAVVTPAQTRLEGAEDCLELAASYDRHCSNPGRQALGESRTCCPQSEWDREMWDALQMNAPIY